MHWLNGKITNKIKKFFNEIRRQYYFFIESQFMFQLKDNLAELIVLCVEGSILLSKVVFESLLILFILNLFGYEFKVGTFISSFAIYYLTKKIYKSVSRRKR